MILSAPLLVLLTPLLAAPASPGLELVYDAETYFRGKATPTAMTMTADGARLRVDFTGAPFFLVIDNEKHEISTFSPIKDSCFRVPESETAELQIAALRRHQRDIQRSAELSDPDKAQLVALDEESIQGLKKPKPKRTQTFTWKQRSKVGSFSCELYLVAEGGADAGQVCFELKGKPPVSFDAAIVEGEWWRGIDALRTLGRLPVLFERKKNGEVLSRATLRSRQEKKVEPAFLMADKACRPWQEMFGAPSKP